ncbi:GNAT family N-acetyltransferase [Labrys monachus]|uniref:GNAT superfamily N-acetyltransferase n=1 Tax=Labrys monachus TaxID=217067 RepID=A0ABU0FFA5_9HYPH|nr:GNAT family N-acetyltransferase [Labrys monachus]MDQ0393201.1 GNAT superfamily N-acetyltransferase [Labrys monachus]
MGIAVRRVEGAEDLGFMLGLGARLAAGIRTAGHTAAEIGAFQDEYSAANLRDPPPEALTVIAVDGEGAKLGFLHALPGHDGITGEANGYVALLAVVDAAEGRGVAQALLRSAEEWARENGYRSLSLDVFSSNGRALHFYEKSGFAAESVRMVKPL